MSGILKYQQLIDTQELSVQCPDASTVEADKLSFRWCCTPITDVMLYPSLTEDAVKNKPPRRLQGDERHCEACALSLFESLEKAKIYFSKFHLPIRLKLGYTHVASGSLSKTDGKISTADSNGHFLFFEYCGANLLEKFTVVDKL